MKKLVSSLSVTHDRNNKAFARNRTASNAIIVYLRTISFCIFLCFFNVNSSKGDTLDWKLSPGVIQYHIDANKEAVMADPWRPAFHLSPPVGYMGDPQGGLYHDGYYHIFYGLNPLRNAPGGWYWAHARSKDLLHWEHTGPGLTPAFDLGLYNVGSGSTFKTDQGELLAFYSASRGDSMEFWRAIFSNEFTKWSHQGPNPVLSLDYPGLPEFHPFWRDPFVFQKEGRTFLIATADLLDEDYVPVPIFEALDDELVSWEYKGLMMTYPKHKLRNFEVPELRPLGDKYVLLLSTDAPVDMTYYFLGEFDLETLTFTPESEGPLDYSGHYYAQASIRDDDGDIYVFSWIPGWDRDFLPNFRSNEEDLKNTNEVRNGCFSFPRKLFLSEKGELLQKPANVIVELRQEYYSEKSRELPVKGPVTEYYVLDNIRGDQLEIKTTLDLGSASYCGLNLLADEEGKAGFYILWSGDVINIEGVKVPIKEWKPGDLLDLHILIDKQIVEVFINGGRYTVTRLVQPRHIKGDYISLISLGGRSELKSLEAWKLKTIY